MANTNWPAWWSWELQLASHLLRRMEDRDFTETDQRELLERATNYREDVVDGRWIVESKVGPRRWEVIVEPDADPQKRVVITAYRVD